MTDEFNDRHEQALKASDRPRPLTDKSRTHISELAMSAFDNYQRDDPERAGLAPVELVTTKQALRDADRRSTAGARWVLAVAAAILAVVAFAGLSTDDDRSTIEAGGPEGNPELADVVRTWCAGNLGALEVDLQFAQQTQGAEERQAAVSTLVDAIDGYFWLLLDSGIRDGSLRADEVGRVQGETATARDRPEPLPADELQRLVQRFTDELAVTSNESPACSIST